VKEDTDDLLKHFLGLYRANLVEESYDELEL